MRPVTHIDGRHLAEEVAAHRGVDAVGADQDVGFEDLAAFRGHLGFFFRHIDFLH